MAFRCYSTGKAIAVAFAALGISGVLLLFGFLFSQGALNQTDHPEMRWTGPELRKGREWLSNARPGKNVRMTSFVRVPLPGELSTQVYPFVELEYEGARRGDKWWLVWTTDRLAEPRKRELELRPGAGSLALVMRDDSRWQGNLTSLGILSDKTGDRDLVFSEIALLPLSSGSLLGALWTEWTLFRRWSPRSVNFLDLSPGKNFPAPMLAGGLWLGASLIVFLLWGLVAARCWDRKSLLLIVVVPWILLDLRWQAALLQQNQETYAKYGGRAPDEKRVGESDGRYYTYVKFLKDELLPREPQRIFILQNSDGPSYWRLRMQYFLLPHNVYNFGRVPPEPKYLRPGDFILVLGAIPGLRYSVASRSLIWERGQVLASRVDSALGMRLYSIEEHR